MKIYFVAGERSGDLHGGNLIKALRAYGPHQYRGFGGDYMKQSGMELVVHYRKMAFMGFAEVLANLKTISKLLKQCKDDIVQFKPDVVVLIDYAGFNLRIAKFAKQQGIKVFWYISPKVWAWNQKRALRLKENVDRMFVILPFEKDFFHRFDWDVDYVGNPVLDAIISHQRDDTFLQRNELNEGTQLVALLPGSRRQEVGSAVDVFITLVKKFPNVQFAMATVDNLSESLYVRLEHLPNVRLIRNDTYNLLAHANAAVVTSGTATLETALFKVPQVVVYKTSWISYGIAKSLIRVPFISLVNLIAGKQVVVELIQSKFNASDVGNELMRLLNEKEYRNQVINEYAMIMKKLDVGSASENTAALMIKYLNEGN